MIIVFVDNINFKNENNFKSLFTYLRLNNIKYIKLTYEDNGIKNAFGDYRKYKKMLPKINITKEEIYNKYWRIFKDELLHKLFKDEDFYLSSIDNDDEIIFDIIYSHHYEDLEMNLRAVVLWEQYWTKHINYNNMYVCFANNLIYTKVLSTLLKRRQSILYVVEHFATGNDFYFIKKYDHIPNNISAPGECFTTEKYIRAIRRLESWDNKNVKKIASKRKGFFQTTNTFLLATQVINDFSIISTERQYLSIINYYKLIIDKIINETGSNLIIKTHPYEKIKNGKSITLNVLESYIYEFHGKCLDRIVIVDNYDIDCLIDNISCAILFNSQIAFEIANRGKPIIALGNPFYKGFFTVDIKDINNFALKDAAEYRFKKDGFRTYIVNLMSYLYNNNDVMKIGNELSQYLLQINEIKIKNSPFLDTKKENEISDPSIVTNKIINQPRELRILAEGLYEKGSKKEALKQLISARKMIPKNRNLKRRYLKMKYGKLVFWIKDIPFK